MTQTAAQPFGVSQAIAVITTLVSVPLLAAPLWTSDTLVWQATGLVLFAVAL